MSYLYYPYYYPYYSRYYPYYYPYYPTVVESALRRSRIEADLA